MVQSRGFRRSPGLNVAVGELCDPGPSKPTSLSTSFFICKLKLAPPTSWLNWDELGGASQHSIPRASHKVSAPQMLRHQCPAYGHCDTVTATL